MINELYLAAPSEYIALFGDYTFFCVKIILLIIIVADLMIGKCFISGNKTLLQVGIMTCCRFWVELFRRARDRLWCEVVIAKRNECLASDNRLSGYSSHIRQLGWKSVVKRYKWVSRVCSIFTAVSSISC